MSQKSTKDFFSFKNSQNLTAIIKSDFQISYRELYTDANKIAVALTKLGIKRKDYITLLLQDELNFIKATIALWFIGAVPVPINTRYLDTEIDYLIDDYNFKFLISDREILLNKTAHKLEVIYFEDIKTTNKNYNFKNPNLSDESVVIFTSGSTSIPKGVVHTFHSLINNIENGKNILNHKKGDNWIASLPFYHIGGFQIICRAFYYGCSIIIPESLDFNHLVKTIKKHKPTHISLVSVQLDKFVNQKIKPPKSLQVSLIGGGFVDDELILQADILGWKPYRVYGSSETASFITAISAIEIKEKPESVGKSLSNVKIKISNDAEILIKSSSLFREYLFNKKETKRKNMHGYYHSGDLGFLDEHGYLFVEARRNDLIVSGGENVNPIEVEKAMRSFDFIKDVCVFPKSNKTWGQIVAAVVVSRDPGKDEKYLKRELKQKLAGHKIPKEIIFADNLPKTSLGKLEREKIKKIY